MMWEYAYILIGLFLFSLGVASFNILRKRQVALLFLVSFVYFLHSFSIIYISNAFLSKLFSYIAFLVILLCFIVFSGLLLELRLISKYSYKLATSFGGLLFTFIVVEIFSKKNIFFLNKIAVSFSGVRIMYSNYGIAIMVVFIYIFLWWFYEIFKLRMKIINMKIAFLLYLISVFAFLIELLSYMWVEMSFLSIFFVILALFLYFVFYNRIKEIKGVLLGAFVYSFFHLSVAFGSYGILSKAIPNLGVDIEFGVVVISYAFLFLGFEVAYMVVSSLAEYRKKVLEINFEEFSEKLSVLKPPEDIIKISVEFLEDNFAIKDISVLLFNEEKGIFEVRYPESLSSKNIFFPVYDAFLIWLSEKSGYICEKSRELLDEEDRASQSFVNSAKDFFYRIKASCCIPIVLNETLIATINFNFGKGRNRFSAIEERILGMFVNDFTIAISNSLLYERIVRLNETLEEKIEKKTKELEETYKKLLVSEKFASLGTLIAGIAHEINTPSGVIRGAITNIRKGKEDFFRLLKELVDKGLNIKDLLLISRYIYDKREEFISSYQLSFKKAMEVEDRVRNVLVKRYGFSDEDDDFVEFLVENGFYKRIAFFTRFYKKYPYKEFLEFIESLWMPVIGIRNIEIAIESIIKLIRALRVYSSSSRSGISSVSIYAIIDNVLSILHNKIKHGIEVIKEYQEVPEIECIQEEINQVISNIIVNAIQAMKGKGTLKIRTSLVNNELVRIDIMDTGPGVPDEIRDKIFDPFFTTKDQGEGTGLGLAISREIIEKHRGTISVGREGNYTVFSITLPIKAKIDEKALKRDNIYKFS